MKNFKYKLIENNKFIPTGSIIVCIIALIFSFVSIKSILDIGNIVENIYTKPYETSTAEWSVRNKIPIINLYIEQIINQSGMFPIEEINRSILKENNDMDKYYDIIIENYLGKEEDKEILLEKMEAFKKLQEEVINSAINGEVEEARNIYYSRNFLVLNELDEILETMIDSTMSNMKKIVYDSKHLAEFTSIFLVILSSILIIIYASFARIISKKRTQDIMHREMLFNMLTENIDDIFFIYNLKRKTLEFVSSNSKNIFGLDHKILLNDSDAMLPYMQDEEIYKLRSIYKTPQINMTEWKTKIIKADTNEIRGIQIRIYPVIEKDKVIRYIIVCTDITEILEAQANLKKALISEKNANNAKKEFLSRMSHEIRTPINAIVGMTTIASSYLEDSGKIEDCLSKISTSSRYLLGIINDILDMSKIETGKMIINRESFDFKNSISNIVSIIHPQARLKGIAFDVVLDGVSYESIIGDELRVNQILINILSNALKFTPVGGKVKMTIKQIEKHRNIYFRFIITDTGIGMSEAELGRIFTPFEQADGTITRKFGGTGLGLSITKELVELMNGSISAYSVENEGSKFVVELPFGINENRDIKKFENINVLVVDDDICVCEYTSSLLSEMGIKAEWVEAGSEAIKKVIESENEGKGFDICLIDYEMDNMNGIEIARRVRETSKLGALKIILSGYDWREFKDEATKVGVDGFIIKPMFQSCMYKEIIKAIGKESSLQKGKLEVVDTYNFSSKRILLVEDNDLNIIIASEILKLTGAQIEMAENGEIAVEKFENSNLGYFDVILMDIQMPILNGYEATERIRKSKHIEGKTIPIIAMTADVFAEDISEALKSGMNGHIAKPIDSEILYSTLEKYFK